MRPFDFVIFFKQLQSLSVTLLGSQAVLARLRHAYRFVQLCEAIKAAAELRIGQIATLPD